MYFIFIVDSAGTAEIVDSAGTAEKAAHTAHMRINAMRNLFYTLENRVTALEGQAAATELAVRALVDNPLNPATAAAEARDILRILEG